MKSTIFLLGIGWASVAFAAGNFADVAQKQDREGLQALLKQRADINSQQPDGTTALQWAAHWNDLETVQLLLNAGANPKIANRYGVSPLSEAATAGNAAMIEALLKAGADPNTAITPDGETVLMTASRSGDVQAVRLLLDHGANVNVAETYRGQTALMWAAAEHHAAIVKILLDAGADWKVHSLARNSSMPKLSAASSVTPMARGGLTALHFAAREGDIECARVMLDAGADVNQVDADGTSVLMVSLINKHYKFAAFLLDRHADPNIADVRGRAALYAAIDARNEDYSAMPDRPENDELPSVDIVRALVEHGADVNAKLLRNLPGRSGMDSGDVALGTGTTSLMRAARAGDVPVMRILLDHGADLALKTADGNTALLFAAGVGYRDKNTRGTEAGALEAVKLLLGTGADLNRKNAKGETVLHGAAHRGADSIAQYLIDLGSPINARSNRGLTPLDYAMGKHVVGQLPVPHDSTVALIRRLGGAEAVNLKP